MYIPIFVGLLMVESLALNYTVDRDYENVVNISKKVYWDWRDENKVTPVRDQGACGAHWAFSAIATIESHLLIHAPHKIGRTKLSAQFLLDCDGHHVGCQHMNSVQHYANIVSQLGGVLGEEQYYPYMQAPKKCRYNPDTQFSQLIRVTGIRRVRNNEQIMKDQLVLNGPLTVGINAASMRKYKGNVIDEPTEESCPPYYRDHSVTIVGYNTYVCPNTGKKYPYWIIKNSWGTQWGDKGYYYLIRGRNACGIAEDISFPYVT